MICFGTLFVAIQFRLVQILCRSIWFVRILYTVNFWFGTPHYVYAIPISAISISATFFWSQHLILTEGLLYLIRQKIDFWNSVVLARFPDRRLLFCCWCSSIPSGKMLSSSILLKHGKLFTLHVLDYCLALLRQKKRGNKK